MTPKQLFISYPSESWNFAQRIAENLAPRIEQSIFIDYRSIDQADFAASILGHLRDSDGVILVVTEFTFADIHRDHDWVRLEIRTALEHNIPVVLVRENGLLPPRDLPDDVRDVSRSQGIPFYREYFAAGIGLLTEFLLRIGVATPRTSAAPPTVIQSSPAPAPQPPPEPQRTLGIAQTLDEAADLLEKGDFEKASFLLNAIDPQKVRPVSLPMLDDLLTHAETLRADFTRRREAALDYDEIARWARRRLTEDRSRAAFADWSQTYADLIDSLDTEGLKARFGTPPPKPAKPRSIDLLPAPFAWVNIPAGKVTLKTEKGWAKNYIPEGKTQTFDVSAFQIARYPLTNAQYRLFIEAGGYTQDRWWTSAGLEARRQGIQWDWSGSEWKKTVTNNPWTEPRYWGDPKWNQPDYPVVGVSWYEAVAYCQWLSEVTGEAIRLPTEQEWQRAAQGDDGRDYPWGTTWDASRCNNNMDNKGTGQTTPVTQYEGKNKGDSPFGVVDMAGNVWEWCSTAYENGRTDLNGTNVRVLRGGSWNGSLTVIFRCDSRDWYGPDGRINYRGFRLALSS